MTIDAVRVMRETPIARVEYHPTVDSTNDRAAQRGAGGNRSAAAGRGRPPDGRPRTRRQSLVECPGSLAFSLLVDAQTVAADESRSPLVALAAAVAMADGVAPLLPTHHIGIHWPNDVYVRIAQLQCVP